MDNSKSVNKLPAVTIAAICIGYLAIRFWRSTDSALWFDEIFSVHAAEHEWNSILSFVALDLIHPPLFYVLLKLWISVGGEGLLWLRSFPILFSVVAIVPLLLLLRELKQGWDVQAICLFFLTVNGILLKYSQEVRMYTLLMCISPFSIWLFTRYFNKGKSFVPLLLVNLVLVYTHYFGWLVVASELVAMLIFQRIKWRPIALMFTLALLSYVPWILSIWSASQLSTGLAQNIGQTPRPGFRDLLKFLANTLEPFYFPATTADPLSLFQISVPLLVIALAAIAHYIINLNRQNADQRRIIQLLSVFVALPVVAAFVGSWVLPYSVWGTRHLIAVFAPLTIILSIALTRIVQPAVRRGFLAAIMAFVGYAFIIYCLQPTPRPSWNAWGQFSTRVTTQPAEKIYVFEDLIAYHFWFELRHSEQRLKVAKIRNIEGVREDLGYFLPRGLEDVSTVDVDSLTESRFWIAYRGDRIHEQHQPLKAFIDRGYRVSDSEVFEAHGENASFVLLEK